MEQENELMNKVIQKAWDDGFFKDQLIENPVQAVEGHFGVRLSIPNGKKLVISDQSDDEVIYINIPAPQDEVELTEDQLEAVSGGIEGNGCIILPILIDQFVIPDK